MIRQFGLLLAVGIVAICISSIVNPLAILGIREYKRPTVGKTWTDGYLARFVNGLGRLPAGFAIVLMFAAAAIFTGGVLAEESLEIQTDPIRWVNQDTQVIEDITTLEDESRRILGARRLRVGARGRDHVHRRHRRLCRHLHRGDPRQLRRTTVRR